MVSRRNECRGASSIESIGLVSSIACVVLMVVDKIGLVCFVFVDR